MIAGIQELLLLLVIVLAIVLLPRITTRERRSAAGPSILRPGILNLKGKIRLAIVMSILWPVITAIHMVPWATSWRPYLLVGLGPVLIFWCAVWVIAGFKNR